MGGNAMKKMFRILAVVLALCLVLTGCAGLNFGEYFQQLGALLGAKLLMPYDQMEYTRPDMEQFQKTLEDCCARAESEKKLDKLVQIIYEFYGVYDDFYTGYALAMIGYSKDQTDTYWQEEYEFCTENTAQVDAGLDRFYRVLAKSPLRSELEGEAYFGAGYFDSYEGDSLFDEVFQDLLRQEQELENRYYDIIAQAGEDFGPDRSFYVVYGGQISEIFLELIRVRNAQAAHAGYDSYPEFAYEFYYDRDYTVQQATAYLADIDAELSSLYRQARYSVNVFLNTCDEEQTYSYVQNTAKDLGGTVWDAFRAMERSGLYDIGANENKLDASYTIYIRNYRSPFVFVNPTGTEYDKLTFAHEFGHFCKDYAAMGGGVGIDVAEIFSQGMEYLSLVYGPDMSMTKLKMLSGLGVYVEQAAYASFEHQVYNLEDPTAKQVEDLFDTASFDLRLDGWHYMLITHFFTEPMYVISYVVSNDAALQLYQMELEAYGSGKQCLLDNLTSTEPHFLAFLNQAGLESPFEKGRLEDVKELLEGILLP
jgi:hypothetical protein